MLNGGALLRMLLYVFGFILGVTLGSWLAFTIFLNDTVPVVLSNDLGAQEFKPVNFNGSSSTVRPAYDKFSNLDAKAINLRILCVVLYTTNDPKRLKAVRSTYGTRCTKMVFYSNSYSAKGFDVKLINTDEAYGSWTFFRELLKRVVNELENFDWILHVDDETYLIYDNLKWFLSKFDRDDPVLIGNVRQTWVTKYFLKEAGLVLSNRSATLLGQMSDDTCDGWWYPSAVEYALNKCMRTLGVVSIDGADIDKGGHRFLPAGPKRLFDKPAAHSWNWNPMSTYQDPSKCCSDSAISFGQVATKEIYLLEYMVYRLTPAGVEHNE